MAHDTAAERAEHGVMTGIVAGDPADDRPRVSIVNVASTAGRVARPRAAGWRVPTGSGAVIAIWAFRAYTNSFPSSLIR